MNHFNVTYSIRHAIYVSWLSEVFEDLLWYLLLVNLSNFCFVNMNFILIYVPLFIMGPLFPNRSLVQVIKCLNLIWMRLSLWREFANLILTPVVNRSLFSEVTESTIDEAHMLAWQLHIIFISGRCGIYYNIMTIIINILIYDLAFVVVLHAMYV